MLASLEHLKGKIDGLALTDESRDDALTEVLEAASERILTMCRYVEADETDRVEHRRLVRAGQVLRLERRPVTAVVIETRTIGSDDWRELTADVLDPNLGEVTIVGAGSEWPPRPTSAQETTYDVLRVTYDVTGIGSEESAPAELRDTAAALAAYWYDRHLAGAAESVTVGMLRKTFLAHAVPPWVHASLGDHSPRAGASLVS